MKPPSIWTSSPNQHSDRALGIAHVKLAILKWTCVSISGQENGCRSSQKSTKHNAKKQLPAEKQPIAEKLCIVRPRVLHTGNSSSCLSSPVPNGPSLVSHAWLRGDPVETRSFRSSSFKKDITWIQDLRSGANSGISTQAIPEHRKDQRRRDNLRKLYLLYSLFGLILFYWNQESQSLDWSFYLSIICTTILVQLFADFLPLRKDCTI